jgi:hypothetical protein
MRECRNQAVSRFARNRKRQVLSVLAHRKLRLSLDLRTEEFHPLRSASGCVLMANGSGRRGRRQSETLHRKIGFNCDLNKSDVVRIVIRNEDSGCRRRTDVQCGKIVKLVGCGELRAFGLILVWLFEL